MIALDLFCGAGGTALGLLAAGFEAYGYDVNADAVATHEHNLGGSASVVDLSSWGARLAVAARHRPALVWASPPCQPFSTAGRWEGAADTERNGWPWALHIIDLTRPRAVIIENVPGLRMHRRDCGALLRLGPDQCPGCYGDAIERDLVNRFDFVSVWIIDAADFGIPQHRRRVFYVATQGQPAIKPTPTHGPGRLPYVTMTQALGLEGVDLLDRPAPTVSASEVKGAGARSTRRARGEHVAATNGPDRPSDVLLLATGRRRLTVRECATLQGFPPAYDFHGTKTSQYRQVGNAVPPTLAEAVARAVIPTLTEEP